MKVICPQEHLSHALAIISRAVSTRAVLPALSHVLISAQSEPASTGRSDTITWLKLVATNLEISFTFFLMGVTVKEAGAIAVPARLVSEYINTLSALGKDSPVEMSLDHDTLTLHFKCGRNEANFKGLAVEEFPSLPTFPGTSDLDSAEAGAEDAVPAERTKAVIEARVLKEALQQVVIAAATDEARPILTGIFLTFESNKLTLAAADSFRLAVKTAPLAGEVARAFTALVPARGLKELEKALDEDSDSLVRITLSTQESQILFQAENFLFTSSLVEGNYPNISKFIPKSYATRALIETDTLSRAVKTATIFAKESGSLLRLALTPGEDLSPGSVLISGATADLGENRNELDAGIEGPANQIAFNSRYLSEVLGVIPTGQVALELQKPSQPAVVKPVGKDDFIYMIMPMHS